MLRSSLAGLIASAGLVISCTVASERAPLPKSATQGESITSLYNRTCAKCHGANGEGGGGGTRTLLTKAKYDQKYDRPFYDAIKNGVDSMGMEAYGSTMSPEQMWGLVVHIRELQSAALRAEFGDPKPTNGIFKSQRHDFKVETVLDKGLKTPWAIDWLPDGRMLITNRPGSMLVLDKGRTTSIANLPEVRELGQGGLMDVTVHPNYSSNGWIYLALTDPAKSGGGGMTKIVRGKLAFEADSVRWTETQTIYEAAQEFYNGAGIHFGSRIVFDGKGHIFFVVGERGGNMKAQALNNPYGKIFRVNEDGSIPKDNPFVGKGDALGGIWSYGHRNPQGLVYTPSGELFDTEHGPRGGDEVNRIQRGANYGWPVVAFSINYNDSAFQIPWPKPEQKISLPVFRWLPSIGACGLDVVRGSAFPQWKGDLVAGGLSGANVDRIRVNGDTLVEREELIHGMGRVREVTVGPDGFVYVALNQPDKIIRLVPNR